MKLMPLIAVLCLSSTVTVYAQIPTGKQGVSSAGDNPTSQAKLQLSTRIVSQQYCHDGNYQRLHLSLRLTFTNVGSETILLDQNSSVYDKYMISLNPKDAADRKYEAEAFINLDLVKSGVRVNALPDASFFVTLKPGESHSTQREFRPILYDGTEDSEDDLRAGDHVLQIRAWTWYYLVPAEQYRQQWREKGYLWSKNVISLPMPFTVELKPALSKCS